MDTQTLDEGAVAAYLSENLRGFEGPMEVTKFQTGQSNPTFLLKTPNRNLVLRRKPPGVLLKSAHAVDREFRVQSALAGAPPGSLVNTASDSVTDWSWSAM